jgi:hypothetical protein
MLEEEVTNTKKFANSYRYIRCEDIMSVGPTMDEEFPDETTISISMVTGETYLAYFSMKEFTEEFEKNESSKIWEKTKLN